MKITIEGSAESIAKLITALLFDEGNALEDEATVKKELLTKILETLTHKEA